MKDRIFLLLLLHFYKCYDQISACVWFLHEDHCVHTKMCILETVSHMLQALSHEPFKNNSTDHKANWCQISSGYILQYSIAGVPNIFHVKNRLGTVYCTVRIYWKKGKL